MTDMELMSKLHKQLLQPNIKKKKAKNPKKNNPIKKWAEDLNKHFFLTRHTEGQQQANEKIFNITNQ